MDSKELVCTVLLDLSKAFDLVDLSLLLSKIKKYHITNTSHQRFQSYLYNRSQRCCINESLSDALFIAQGFPQGSILGPVLFMLYINDLPLGIFMLTTLRYGLSCEQQTYFWSLFNASAVRRPRNGRLVLILQVYSMAFKVVSLNQITVSPKTR